MHSRYNSYGPQDSTSAFNASCKTGRSIEAKLSKTLSHEVPLNDHNEHAIIWVAKLLSISAESESWVAIVASKCGLRTLKQIQTAKPTKQILPARGIYKFRTNISFRMLATVFSRKLVVLHKHIYIVLLTGPPECVVEPKRKEWLKLAVEINHRTIQGSKISAVWSWASHEGWTWRCRSKGK